MSIVQSIHFEELTAIVKETARLFCDDEAAGHISIKGRALTPERPQTVLATNGHIHAEMMEALTE